MNQEIVLKHDSMDSSYCSTNIFDYKQQQQQQQHLNTDSIVVADNVPIQPKPKSVG
jgi:hypothetical protein